MARNTQTSVKIEPVADSGLVLAGQRDNEIVSFERSVVSFFVEAAHLLGVPKSVAAIYGIVFSAPTALTFAEIESRLDISKGSISQGLRVLRDVGAIQEVSSTDDRAERFAPDLELRKLVQRFIDHRLHKQLDDGRGRLNNLIELIPETDAAHANILGTRLKHLQTWHDKAHAVLPVIKTFLALTKT